MVSRESLSLGLHESSKFRVSHKRACEIRCDAKQFCCTRVHEASVYRVQVELMRRVILESMSVIAIDTVASIKRNKS